MPATRCLVSVIIPVHNDEGTLIRCLDSVFSQGLREMEIILVNNGSTDTSVELCETYREKDQRVRVVHMEHDTWGVACNKGLEAALGKYVHFVNAADYIEGEMEALSDTLLKNLDVIFLDTSFYNASNFWDISHHSVLRRLCKDIPARLWDKLIRRDILIEKDIRFTEGVIWESVDFNIKLYIHANVYGAVEFPYARHTEEAVHDSAETFDKIISTLSKWAGPAESTYEEYSTFIHIWMAGMYCDLLIPMYHRLPSDARAVFYTRMKDFQWLLGVRKTRGSRLLEALYIILGPLATSYIIAVFLTFFKGYDMIEKMKMRRQSNDESSGNWLREDS